MPLQQQAYLVLGTVNDSGSLNEEDAEAILKTSQGTSAGQKTNSDGRFIYDLSNIPYTNGETVTVTTKDKFDNEISTDTFVVNQAVGFTELTISLSVRTDVEDNSGKFPNAILHSVGKEPITSTNPLNIVEASSPEGTGNPDFVFTRDGSNLVTDITMTIGSDSYKMTFTRSSGFVTVASKWVKQ